MKIWLIAFSSLFIGTALADDHIKCDLKITNNKVSCPIFRMCPEKALRESTVQVDIVANEFDETVGNIAMKKVVLFPGTKKEDKNKVLLFRDDQREQKLIEKNSLDLVVYDIKSSIEYKAKKEGNRSIVNFKTPNYTFDMTLTGNNSNVSGYIDRKSVV